MGKPQPKRKPRVPKRKPQPKRRPQPKKIGKCECRALAIKKCGSRGTNRQTRCRNAYIAQCNKRCQPKRKPRVPRRKPVPKRKPRVPRRKPQPKKIGKCECRALAVQKCGSAPTNKIQDVEYNTLLNVTKDVVQKENHNQEEENQEFQKENQEFQKEDHNQEENHNQRKLENVNVEH